jgi:hypothetical protein
MYGAVPTRFFLRAGGITPRRMLPNNMLREIYARADPRTQARMRAASSAVHELPKPPPQSRVHKDVKRLKARADVLKVVVTKRAAPLRLYMVPNYAYHELAVAEKSRSDKEMRAKVDQVNKLLDKLERELQVTNAERSRAATALRKNIKSRRTTRYGEPNTWREHVRAARKREKAWRRRRRPGTAASAVAAATATTLVPGRGAPFAVLRGGQRRSLANAVDASARHPAVSGR